MSAKGDLPIVCPKCNASRVVIVLDRLSTRTLFCPDCGEGWEEPQVCYLG